MKRKRAARGAAVPPERNEVEEEAAAASGDTENGVAYALRAQKIEAQLNRLRIGKKEWIYMNEYVRIIF